MVLKEKRVMLLSRASLYLKTAAGEGAESKGCAEASCVIAHLAPSARTILVHLGQHKTAAGLRCRA